MRFTYVIASVIALDVACCGLAHAQEVVSKSGRYVLTVPDGWTVKTAFSGSPLVIAAQSPKEDANDDFRENVVVMALPKKPDATVATVAAQQDSEAKERRPDFAVSDETPITVGGLTGVVRICTMTFPEFVSKNRQYVLDAGDQIVVMTCSVPTARFADFDAVMTSICQSLTTKPATAAPLAKDPGLAPDAKAIEAVVAAAVAAGLPDCTKAVMLSGTAKVTTTVTDKAGDPPLPTRLSTMQTTGPDGVAYTFAIKGLHARLADGTWWLGMRYLVKPDALVRVDETALEPVVLATLTADAAVSHPFTRDDAKDWLEGVSSDARDAAGAVLEATAPVTYRLELNRDDLPLAVVALSRAGYAHAPWLAHALALQRARDYWLQRYWAPEAFPFDPTGAYDGMKELEQAWRDAHKTFTSEASAEALRRSLHRQYRAWLMNPEPSQPLNAAQAAKAAIGTLDPKDPQHRTAGIETLLAAAALPVSPVKDATVAQRLQAWAAPSHEAPKFRVQGGGGAGGATMSTSFVSEVPAYVPLDADLPALIALVGDARPSRWKDFSGARSVGDNALRAIAELLKEDPRVHGATTGLGPWSAKERTATATALAAWWKQEHPKP